MSQVSCQLAAEMQMDIAKLSPKPSALTVTGPLPSLKLQPGQTLAATVQAKLSNNLVELLINNQRLQARTSQSLEVGQRLQLQVEKTTHPIVLRALPAPQQDPKAALQAVRNDLLKTQLPKTAGFTPLIKTLNAVLQNSRSIDSLPKPLQQNLQNLSNSLNQPQQLSSKEGLKQAIKQSGLFLEAYLANSVADKATQLPGKASLAQNDFKASLLKLAALLSDSLPVNNAASPNRPLARPLFDRPIVLTQPPASADSANKPQATPDNKAANSLTPATTAATKANTETVQNTPPRNDALQLIDRKEIAQQIEQALSKIQLQQNSAIVLDKQELPVWNMTLPLLDNEQIEQLELSIYQDGKGKHSDEQQNWNIELTLELEELGNIYARVHLAGETVRTALWAEHDSTLNLIRTHLPELEQQLNKTGLDVVTIQTFTGKPELKGTPAPKQNLVDVRL